MERFIVALNSTHFGLGLAVLDRRKNAFIAFCNDELESKRIASAMNDAFPDFEAQYLSSPVDVNEYAGSDNVCSD